MEKHNPELAKKLYSSAANDRLTKPCENSKTMSASDESARAEAVSIRLWQRMGEMFGAVFFNQYGATDENGRQTWKEGLAGYSEAQIARGVKNCLDWNKDFPPNLAQFAKLCLQLRAEEKPNVTEQRIAREKETGVLDHLGSHARSDIAKRELERMKRVVAGEDVEEFETSYHNCGLNRRWA